MKKLTSNKIFRPFLLAIKLSFIYLLFSLFLASCTLNKIGKNLDQESQKFISEVRYLITPEERQAFLQLPPSERSRFIEEFWKKRDPDPETEENIFKEEYYKRIKEANRLFSEGGTPGWLQDRGRIYILIGAPDQRETYPRGRTFYGTPMEIWYYGFFSIIFRDNYWNGNYQLDPTSAQQLAEINQGQMSFRPRIHEEKIVAHVLEFELTIDKTQKDKVIFRVKAPYKNIVLSAEGEKLKTTLELSLAILDSSQQKTWEYQDQYPISLDKDELGKLSGQEYVIEIPAVLKKGDYDLVLELTNLVDKSKGRKKISLQI